MMDNDIKETSVVVTEIVEFEVGHALHLVPVKFQSCDATQTPQPVKNWGFFDGAVLAVVIGDKSERQIIGTACMIAPGLAVTAAHIFTDVIESIRTGELGISCFGIATDSGEFWRVTHVCYASGEEIAFLSIAKASIHDASRPMRTFDLSTRAPRVGEVVTMIGFRFTESGQLGSDAYAIVGHMYAVNGAVRNVYPHRRDNSIMPFPVIEVDCGSVGGMSGGALLDGEGLLLGVTSRGLETDDGLGPTYAAWIIGGLNRRVTISWPKGLYPPNSHLLDLNPRLLRIQGREHIQIHDGTSYTYKPWFGSD